MDPNTYHAFKMALRAVEGYYAAQLSSRACLQDSRRVEFLVGRRERAMVLVGQAFDALQAPAVVDGYTMPPHHPDAAELELMQELALESANQAMGTHVSMADAERASWGPWHRSG